MVDPFSGLVILLALGVAPLVAMLYGIWQWRRPAQKRGAALLVVGALMVLAQFALVYLPPLSSTASGLLAIASYVVGPLMVLGGILWLGLRRERRA